CNDQNGVTLSDAKHAADEDPDVADIDNKKLKKNYAIADADRINFQPGDIVGSVAMNTLGKPSICNRRNRASRIVHETSGMLMYKTCVAGSNGNHCQDLVYAESLASHIVGATAVFDTEHYDFLLGRSRAYAISLDIKESLVPTCAAGAVTIADDYTGQLFVISGSNVETYDDVTYSIAPTPLPVTITTVSGVEARISLTATIAAAFPSSTYTVTVTIADVCGTSSTCQQLITVTFTNKPISITSLPGTASVSEKVSTAILLHTVTWSDANVGDTATCVIASVTPVAGLANFQILETIPLSGIWLVKNVASHTFDVGTVPSYSVDIKCDDQYGSSDTNTLTVMITPNQAPQFSNIPDRVCVGAPTTGAGVTVFTVTASDADDPSTDISMNVTATPSPAPFYISQAGFEAVVVTTTSLLVEEVIQYTLSFCVWDLQDALRCVPNTGLYASKYSPGEHAWLLVLVCHIKTMYALPVRVAKVQKEPAATVTRSPQQFRDIEKNKPSHSLTVHIRPEAHNNSPNSPTSCPNIRITS
ncbi:hypothetical protein ScPMuIL_006749, partial [Solemya velum]